MDRIRSRVTLAILSGAVTGFAESARVNGYNWRVRKWQSRWVVWCGVVWCGAVVGW